MRYSVKKMNCILSEWSIYYFNLVKELITLNMNTFNTNTQKCEMLDSSKVSSADIISFAFNKIDANDIVGLYAGLCERSYLEMLMCHKSLTKSPKSLTYAALSKAVELLRVAVTKSKSYHYNVQHAIREFVHAALVFVQTSGNRVSDMVRARVLEVADIITSIPRCVCPDCPPLQKGTNTPLRRSLRIREHPGKRTSQPSEFACFQVTLVPSSVSITVG
jgi:hypothetical protein